MTRRPKSQSRSGATLVELAIVVAVFLMFFFGILEYCRLVFVREVIINAAREGARYAVVNSVGSTVVADTQARVKTRMCGLDTQTKFYSCQVYKANAAGTSIGAAGDAAFGEYIAVQIDYDYTPIVPSLLFMSKTIRITARDLMYSEAN